METRDTSPPLLPRSVASVQGIDSGGWRWQSIQRDLPGISKRYSLSVRQSWSVTILKFATAPFRGESGSQDQILSRQGLSTLLSNIVRDSSCCSFR